MDEEDKRRKKNDATTLEINMKLQIKRDYPLEAKQVDHVDSRKLNFSQLHDCLAGKKLLPSENKEEAESGMFRIKKSCNRLKS